jgi:hypothetical protein
MTLQLQLSAAAREKIEIANRTWGTARQAILDVYNQLLSDGWTELEAGDICRKELTFFASKTLRRILPEAAEHQNMKREIAVNCPQEQQQEQPELEPVSEPQPQVSTSTLKNESYYQSICNYMRLRR